MPHQLNDLLNNLRPKQPKPTKNPLRMCRSITNFPSSIMWSLLDICVLLFPLKPNKIKADIKQLNKAMPVIYEARRKSGTFIALMNLAQHLHTSALTLMNVKNNFIAICALLSSYRCCCYNTMIYSINSLVYRAIWHN